MTTDATTTTTIPRLDGESNRAYDARVQYVTMGPQRSQELVSQKLAKSRQIVSRWSARYDWAATARAWDDQQAAAVSAKAAQEYRARLEKHRSDAQSYGEALCGVAIAMLAQLQATSKNIEYTPAALATISKALTTGLDLRAHALDLDRLIPTLTQDNDDA